MRYEGAPCILKFQLWAATTDGPVALPGKYQVRLTVDGHTEIQPLEIVPDSRLNVSMADMKKQFDLLQNINAEVTRLHEAVQQIRDVRTQIKTMDRRMAAARFANAKAISDAGTALDRKMSQIEEAIVRPKAVANEDVLNYPIKLNNLLAALATVVGSADAAPTDQAVELFHKLQPQADEQLAKWDELQKSDLAAFNNLICQQNMSGVVAGAADH